MLLPLSIDIIYYADYKPKFQHAFLSLQDGDTFTTIAISKADISKFIKRHFKKPVYKFSVNSHSEQIKYCTVENRLTVRKKPTA